MMRRLIRKITNLPKEIKWFIQRGKRGYADCDLWLLYGYISDIMVSALKHFDERRIGYVEELGDKGWSRKLKEMREGFEFYKNFDVIEDELWDKFGHKWGNELDKRRVIAQKKLAVFVKYFEHLWD